MSSSRAIIIVRHGQSEHHVRRLTGGWTDTSLTELGHEQAHRVAARLRAELGEREIVLYTSDLLRAGETARHIADAFGVEPVVDERIREHNNGEAADLTIDEARVRYPAWFRKGISLWTEGAPPGAPGAETGEEFFARAGSFLDSLTVDGPTPVVVTHGGTIMCLVGSWLGLESRQLAPVFFAAYTTSITTLVHNENGHREIERLNDVSHLAGLAGWASLGEVAG